jgi:hypothetical protein
VARSLAVTFDYRCPFAYNGNLATVKLLQRGADLDVRFVAFSLDQVHADDDEPPVWERPPADRGTGVLALLYGIAVRDQFPDHFYDAHLALFAARHEHGQQLHDESVLHAALAGVGLDPAAVAAEVEGGAPLATLAREHTESVERHGVFGVPTFIEGDAAVFVRLMDRGNVDDVTRVLDMLGWDALNEFKRTRIPR